MNKKSLLIILVVIVLLGVVGVLVKGQVLNKGRGLSLDKNAGNGTTTSNDKTAGDVIKGTIEELMAMGKSVKCTFKQEADGSKVESLTYISGDRYRVDSKVENEEDSTMSDFHMVSDGTYAYIWGDDQEQGMKMNIKEMQEQNENDEQPNQAFNVREAMKEYNYDCSPWIVDQSKFSVPTDIEFSDLSEMMKGLEGMTKELCKSCDNMDTAEEIAECKTNLDCE